MISLIEQIKGSLQEEKNIKLNKEQIKVLTEINLNLLKKKNFLIFFMNQKMESIFMVLQEEVKQ